MGYQALWCFGDSWTVQADISKKVCELEQGPVVLYVCCLILKYSPKKEQQTLSLQSPGKCKYLLFAGIRLSYDFFKDENKFSYFQTSLVLKQNLVSLQSSSLGNCLKYNCIFIW